MTQTCRLYAITPAAFEPVSFAEILKSALDGGDIACLQLRLKNAGDNEIRKATEVLMPIAQANDVAFLINDRPDLAAELGADGAHIGQDDVSLSEARKILGADHIIGVTCHNSRHLAMVAGEDGADYVAFGAFFPTQTKDPKTQADTEILSWWSEMVELPSVAIGGIKVDNCAPLIKAGADFLAVCAGIWDYDKGPGAAVAAFNAEMTRE